MHIIFNEKEKQYLVRLHLGYTLSHFGDKLIKSGHCLKISENKKKIIDEKEIFDRLYDLSIFSEHYIEKTIFYKHYHAFCLKNYNFKNLESSIIEEKEKTKNMNKKEIELYFKECDEAFKKSAFDLTSHFLKGASIEEKETLYKLPYLFEGKQLGFRTIENVLRVNEHGVVKKYKLITYKLSCILDENENYIHIEPCVSNEFYNELSETPFRVIDTSGKDSYYMLSKLYDFMSDDLIHFEILKNIKIK